MFPVFPRRKRKGEEFMEAFNQGPSVNELISPWIKKHAEGKENEALKRLTGQDFSGVSPDLKKEFVKGLSMDPFKARQQERLAQDSILRRYSKRIGEIDSAIKSGMGSYSERKELESQRKLLQAERDELLDFKALKKAQDPSKEESSRQQPKRKKRVKFDPKNPAHIKRRNQVLAKTQGDRKKAEKILLEEFEL